MNKYLLVILSLFIAFSEPAISGAMNCHGRFLNPVTEINWKMIFPIRIAGFKVDPGMGSTDSDLTYTSPVCMCPSRVLGIPVPGIMITYHEPLYIQEIARSPGCMSSLGGMSILPGFEMEATELDEDDSTGSRWQTHWYEYPVFSLLEIFQGVACSNTSGFALAYMSELDPTWQNDPWGAVFAPEAALFANPIAQASCAVDAVAATVNHPLDAMFWCAGSWGGVYPLTGNTNAVSGRIQSAHLAGAKMIAKLSRLGALWDTVGPQAMCHSMPMPIWIKSQFSIDTVYPVVNQMSGMSIGAATPVRQYIPPQTYPMYENIHQVIFQEQQCCLRP